MIPSVESVFCTDCGQIRPVSYDYMPGGLLNDHDATDILCDHGHIICTLHHPKHTSPVEQITKTGKPRSS